MVTAVIPSQLEKSARNLLACAKWMRDERPQGMREPEINAITRERFQTNWGTAYNSQRILTKLGEEIIEEAISRSIAFSALYVFTTQENPVHAFRFVMNVIDAGEFPGHPSHDRMERFLKDHPVPEQIKKQTFEDALMETLREAVQEIAVQEQEVLAVESIALEETLQEELQELVELKEDPEDQEPFPDEEGKQEEPVQEAPAELSGLDHLLSPYQTRFRPYVKPIHGLMLMRTPAHLPISRGRRAVVDSRNVLDEESLMHMKLYVVAQANNGRIYVSRQFAWLSVDHFREVEKKDRGVYVEMRAKSIRLSMEGEMKKKGLHLIKNEEILSSMRSYVVQFLRDQHYIIGEILV